MKDKRLLKVYLFIIAIAFALFLSGTNVLAAEENAASFYRGKTLRLVVPYTPGGGQDLHARFMAPVLAKYLKCTVVVINKPGAGGLVAMNDLYEKPRTNGLTLAVAPEGLALAQAVEEPGVRFDVRKFGWIISLYKNFRYLMVGIDSPYKSIDDLKKLKQPKVALATVSSPAGPPTILALEVLNLEKGRVVAGYPGSIEMILAIKRLEADFTVMSKSHVLRKDSLVRPLLAMESKRAPELPDIPAFTELDVTPEIKKMSDTIMMGQSAGCAIVTPPGVSKGKIVFLRKVMNSVVHDPDYLSKVEKAGFYSDPISGEETAAKVDRAVNITPEEVKKLRYVLFEKYF